MARKKKMQLFELETNLSSESFDMPFSFPAKNKREAWKWAKKRKLKGERLLSLKRVGTAWI